MPSADTDLALASAAFAAVMGFATLFFMADAARLSGALCRSAGRPAGRPGPPDWRVFAIRMFPAILAAYFSLVFCLYVRVALDCGDARLAFVLGAVLWQAPLAAYVPWRRCVVRSERSSGFWVVFGALVAVEAMFGWVAFAECRARPGAFMWTIGAAAVCFGSLASMRCEPEPEPAAAPLLGASPGASPGVSPGVSPSSINV